MAINERASSDARHARTGKDAGLYNGTGDLLASMESFQAKATYNNVKYKPMSSMEVIILFMIEVWKNRQWILKHKMETQ